MSSESQVTVELQERDGRGQVAYVTFNNAKRANSMNTELMHEFLCEMETLSENEGLRVLVLTGAGDRSFCAGANVQELVRLDAASGKAFITLIHRLSESLRQCPVPVIARINGACLGAGLEIAAACDMRVADEGALLGMPEVDVGLPSVIEAALFPQLIGWGRTKQLIYTAENISAARAQSWGLVEEVAAKGELDNEVEKLVAAIVKADARAVRMQKTLMRSWESMSVTDAIEEGIRCFTEACRPGTHREVVQNVIDRLKAK